MMIAHLKFRPARRNAGFEAKGVAAQLKTQNRFNGDAVEPGCRARVPRPAAAPRVRRGAIHIGASDIGLNSVMLDLLRRGGMVDRTEKAPEFNRAFTVTF